MDNYEEINYRGSRQELPEGFRNLGIMMPKGPVKKPKQPFFKMYKEFGYWHIKIRALRYPGWLDKLLRPLCRFGWHRWVASYGYSSWTIPPPNSNVEYTAPKNQTIHICARCKETKTVNVK